MPCMFYVYSNISLYNSNHVITQFLCQRTLCINEGTHWCEDDFLVLGLDCAVGQYARELLSQLLVSCVN